MTPTICHRIRASLSFSFNEQEDEEGWSWHPKPSKMNEISWRFVVVRKNCGLLYLTAGWLKSFMTHSRVECVLCSLPSFLPALTQPFVFFHVRWKKNSIPNQWEWLGTITNIRDLGSSCSLEYWQLGVWSGCLKSQEDIF